MSRPEVSVVIITRNRAQDLVHCLGSLAGQTTLLDELIVIDNYSTDDTKKVVSAFIKNSSLSCKYVVEKKVGYPSARNRGLSEASHSWVAFIDDDCVADTNWFKHIKQSIKKHRSTAAILGLSDTYYSQNIYSLSTFLFDSEWKEQGLKKQVVTDYEVLDSKNIVYNTTFLQSHKIKFDESRLNYFYGAAEDCDLGMQIHQAGGKAVYDPEIKVSHKDSVGLRDYLNKYFFALAAYDHFKQKWESGKSQTQKIPLKKRMREIVETANFSFYKKAHFIILVYSRVILNSIFNSLILTKTGRSCFKKMTQSIRI